jgi:hypothetical protein
MHKSAAGGPIEPRGLAALASKLDELGRYAVPGSLVGTGVAPARLAMISAGRR